MLLGGAVPIYAALYQLVATAMLFSASALASGAGAVAIRGSAFRDPGQLRLG